jgi:AraC family transcriptional regulator
MTVNGAIQFPKGCYVGVKVKECVFGNIITSETIFPAGLSSDWHYHANPHFSHILSGGSTEVRESDSQLQVGGKGLYYCSFADQAKNSLVRNSA